MAKNVINLVRRGFLFKEAEKECGVTTELRVNRTEWVRQSLVDKGPSMCAHAFAVDACVQERCPSPSGQAKGICFPKVCGSPRFTTKTIDVLCFFIIQGSPITWIILWVRLGNGPLHPGGLYLGWGQGPTLSTAFDDKMGSSPPPGVEPGSMIIGPQNPYQTSYHVQSIT
ncbi:hypothetical protein YC2023_007824 [Brassica napus]